MITNPLRPSSDVDLLASLVEEAKYYLTDTDIESLRPRADAAGDPTAVAAAVASLKGVLYAPGVAAHPFSKGRLDAIDRERMDLTLVRVLSDPHYFAFTCYHLMSMTEGQPLRLLPFQSVTLWELWWRAFPMLIYTRGGSKSTSLAFYILLRLLFTPGSRIAVVAKSLRQSMIIWETCARIWHNSPLLRDLCGRGTALADNGPRRGGSDRCEFRVNESVALFLPLGATGDTVRGIRAGYNIVDECASISPTVYATVVQGFSAVSADPADKMAARNRERILKRLGVWTPDMDDLDAESRRPNQSVMAGTASYRFNHFYRYWKHYRDIITTRGDPDRLAEVLGGPPPATFDWRNYSVIRLPHDILPAGYMDPATVERARQISTPATFKMEYGCLFGEDSDGFFKRSVIERATVGGGTLSDPPPPAVFPSCGPVEFEPVMRGDPARRYVFGVDPALQRDNFAVAVLEVWPDHRRLVHVWTTNKREHRSRRRGGTGAPMDFYRYCVRKLRDLFAAFPPAEVLVDAGAGGGGHTLVEAFSDPDKAAEGERPVYPVIDPDHPLDTDFLAGDHLLRLCEFANAAWQSDANWSLRKDLEDRVLLFPRCDEVTFGLAPTRDVDEGRVVVDGGEPVAVEDTLENVLYQVEETKNELAQIQHSQTGGGREQWEAMADEADVGRRRRPTKKDRYSALLMANWGARRLQGGSSAMPTPPLPGRAAGGGRRPAEAGANEERIGGIPVSAFGRVVVRSPGGRRRS